MSDDKNAGVDPRFDPAFQRGFDPSVPAEESTRAPRARKSALAEPSAPAPVASAPAAPAPVVAPPVRSKPAAATTVAPVPPRVMPAADAADEDTSSDETAEEPAAAGSGRNPYLLFLGILAIALLATGIWLFVRSGDEFNSKVIQSQGDFMSLTATINAAPFIAMLGAATAIGVLFVFAIRWRSRR